MGIIVNYRKCSNLDTIKIRNTPDDKYIFDSEYEQFVERHSLKMRTIRN